MGEVEGVEVCVCEGEGDWNETDWVEGVEGVRWEGYREEVLNLILDS